MGLQGAFTRFVVDTDYSTGANGASSTVFIAGSDVGSLLMPLSSNFTYYITDIYASIRSVNDTATAVLGTCDSDGAAGVFTPISGTLSIATGAALTTEDDDFHSFNTPIPVEFSAAANFMSVRIAPNDSDAIIGAGYNGFKIRTTYS